MLASARFFYWLLQRFQSSGADSIAGLAQITGDVSGVDAVDDDTDARNADKLALETVLHLVCRDFTVKVDDVVLDESRDVLCAFEFAGGSSSSQCGH